MTSPVTIKVHTFGGFALEAGGKRISEQDHASRKCWMLLKYLILFRDRPIPKEELADILWPQGESDNPLNTLKTLVHRARTLLDGLGVAPGSELLLLDKGLYSWNRDWPPELDCESFDALCLRAASLEDADEALTLRLEALDICDGEFLPGCGGELWAVGLCTYYHVRFVELCREAAPALYSAGRLTELTGLMTRAISAEPYDETLHVWLIRSLMASGAHEDAMRHYNETTEMLFTRLGVTPSEELAALYRELSRGENLTELNLGVVRSRLIEEGEDRRSFYCEYEVFREIFQLEARSCARSGQVVQLAMISALDGVNPLTGKQLRVTMERLQDAIASGLRMGDSFTRYSANQFLLMLPSASVEDSAMVVERVVRSFRRAWPKNPAELHFSTLPLPPRM